MSITLGGLSSGLDTNTIIDQLLQIERRPITRLEDKKKAQSATLEAVKKFDDKLDVLMAKVDALDSASTLLTRKTSLSSSSYLAGSASGTAATGSYDIKVGRLAQTEKAVFQGVADKTVTTFGSGTMTINNDALAAPISITVDVTNNTLEGLRDAINLRKEDTGVSASIINDGSGTPYRLVLSGKEVSNANITLDTSGLTGGEAFPTKDAAVSRAAQTALLQVDGITITSNTNTISEAISGLTLNLTHADAGFDAQAPDWSQVAVTTLTVSTDNEAIKNRITEFVTAFNDLVKAANDPTMAGETGARVVLSNLRGKFTDTAEGTGLFSLGIKTQKDGTILLDSAKLSKAVEDDLPRVETLLAGTASVGGIADRLKSSLDVFTSPLKGFLAGRQKSYDFTIRRLDREIARGEARLALKEEQLVAKFSALEQLVSSSNSQKDYLVQQLSVSSK